MPIAKVTEEYMQSKIRDAWYYQPAGTTFTICVLTLDNGILISGDSACLNPEDFDAEVGKLIARQEAITKLWFAEGFHRAEMAMLAEQAAGK
jgi:hypothetical protein